MPTLIISFIVEAEGKVADGLESLAEVRGDAKDELRKIAEECRKDANQLERIFKETVVELSLEPLEGFEVVSLRTEIESLLNSKDKVTGLIEVLSKLEKLYTSFSKSIASISPETSIQLKKMLRKKEKHKKYLESLK